MKLKSGLLICALAVLAACSVEERASQQRSVAEVDSTPHLADGAYALVSVDVTEKDQVSSYQRDQIKIYTQNRFMFAFYNELTARVDAGTGYAEWVNGVLVETPIANQDGSIEDLSFDLTIIPTDTGFTQSLSGMKYGERSVDMVEQWRTLSTESGEFDGLWKLESSSPEIASRGGFFEMKMIGGGHYAFFQRFSNEGELVKHFGFGSFQVNESGEITESAMTSSIEGYAGREYQVDLKLVDSNHLVQSFELNGVVITQTYVRI